MNKTELVKKIAKQSNHTQKDVLEIIDSFQDVIGDELAKGNEIQLTGFGSFEVTQRPEHMGINPKTGETILIKASKSPKFKASKLLKDRVNN